jgi:hypothetical protein
MTIKLDPKDLENLNIYQEHLEFISINRQTGECEARIAEDWHSDLWCPAVKKVKEFE